MTFFLGTSCWHVVGWRGEVAQLCCGSAVLHSDAVAVYGGGEEVSVSGMGVCRTCDKATGGEAVKYVAEVGLAYRGGWPVSGQPGGQTVYVMSAALVAPSLPKWHREGRHDGYRWLTRCGRLLVEWPGGGDRPTWHAVPIRRLYAGTFAIPCGTCQKADLANKRGQS